jgi:hypothetical protein
MRTTRDRRRGKEELKAIEQQYQPQQRGRPRKEQQPKLTPEEAIQHRKNGRRYRRAKEKAKHPSRQYNFVDPDSRVLKDIGTKSFVQGYNAQAAVDSHAQVIVAAEVTQQVTDRKQLLPMVKSVCETTGRRPKTITADAGYWDTDSLKDDTLANIEMLVPPDSTFEPPEASNLAPNAPRCAEAVRMREVLASSEAKKKYGLRKTTVEPVFGQIKEGRGIRRFRLRGLANVQAEWKLICATHDLLKLFRHRTGPTPASPRRKQRYPESQVPKLFRDRYGNRRCRGR